MRKTCILLIIGLFQNSFCQKLENLGQSFSTKGHFVVTTISDYDYKERSKDSYDLITPEKNNGNLKIEDVKNVLPQLFDD